MRLAIDAAASDNQMGPPSASGTVWHEACSSPRRPPQNVLIVDRCCTRLHASVGRLTDGHDQDSGGRSRVPVLRPLAAMGASALVWTRLFRMRALWRLS